MISIVVVSYNTDAHLGACLESLSRHDYRSIHEILVINNGRALPDSLIRCNGHQVHVVNNKRNVGYATALNQGAGLSDAPYLVCLNADTRLPPGSLEPLLDCLDRRPDIGVVGPRMVYPDGTLQYSCRRDYTCGSILGRRVPFGMLPMVEPALRAHLMLDDDHDRELRPDWLQGSCLMIPRRVFEQLGGFDQRYFLYFEDYDFCQRVRQHGLDVLYLPDSKIVHHYARTSAGLGLFRREFWHHLASAVRYYSHGGKHKGRTRRPLRPFAKWHSTTMSQRTGSQTQTCRDQGVAEARGASFPPRRQP